MDEPDERGSPPQDLAKQLATEGLRAVGYAVVALVTLFLSTMFYDRLVAYVGWSSNYLLVLVVALVVGLVLAAR